ncbi:MAG: Arc family DNA binding domain-containing protein [Fuerstiella sp.]
MPRESFLLRTDPKILDALRRWSEDELRSANGQLEFVLRNALKAAGRLPNKERQDTPKPEPEAE